MNSMKLVIKDVRKGNWTFTSFMEKPRFVYITATNRHEVGRGDSIVRELRKELIKKAKKEKGEIEWSSWQRTFSFNGDLVFARVRVVLNGKIHLLDRSRRYH